MAEACQRIETDLGIDEALDILLPYFEVQQEEFVSEGFGRTAQTRPHCAPWLHDSPRHFAACRDDGLVILVAPELCELPEPMVMGIIGHELGHATDFLYPAEFCLDSAATCVRRDRKRIDDVQWARFVKAWEQRDDDMVEQMADGICEYATGRSIGYLGPCQLQVFDRGSARPQGLR